MSATLSIKGQVTIPKQIRDAMGWQPGMPVDTNVLNTVWRRTIHENLG